MRAEWEEVTVKDLCSVKTGKKDVNQGNPLGKYPFFTCAKQHTYSDEWSFDGEALLIAGNGDVGNLSYCNGKFEAYQRTYVLMDFQRVLPHFLYYVFDAGLKPMLFGQKLGNTMPYIKKGMITDFPVPLPPLEEQRRIVAILDEAFEGLARAKENAEANLQNARELFEGIKSVTLQEAQSEGKPVVLDDVTAITSSLVDPRENAHADLPHLGAGNMITGSDKLVDVKTAREEKLISGKYLFDEETVLYSKIRPYLRKAARPDFEGLCSADVYPLTTTKDLLDRDFLFHLLLADDFTQYAIQGSDRAGMPKVNRRHLFAYEFKLPPLDIQRSAAAKIDEVKRSCDLLVSSADQKLEDVEELRQSVLQKAFAGELE